MSLTWTFRDGSTTEDVKVWAERFEDPDYRRVANFEDLDHVPPYRVSTIWQGMPSIGNRPNNYETAMFINGEWVGEARFHTEDEALVFHEQAITALRETGSTQGLEGVDR